MVIVHGRNFLSALWGISENYVKNFFFARNYQEISKINKIDEKLIPGAVTVIGGPGTSPKGQKSTFTKNGQEVIEKKIHRF